MKLNEMYSEVREHLRRQHDMNRNEVHGKGFPNHSYYNDTASGQNPGISFFFKFKVFVFISSVMLFSCYLYGGQDIKKGAKMVYNDLRSTVSELEDEEPMVKEVIGYCRQGYHWIKDITNEYVNEEKNTE